jgi:hypothetical protein
MTGVGGAANNPTLADHTWVSSGGGTIKVDTPNSLLGDDEYCVRDGMVVAVLSGVKEDSKYQFLTTADVDGANELDESKIII